MRETAITFTTAGLTLSGTLMLPAGDGPFPAALLLPGSGPVDRDSNHRRMPLDVTRQLAVALAETGVASLRYDKRGVGRSEGDFMSAGFLGNADDAEAALGVLAARPEVAAARVVLVGHSEGALLATIVAARSDVPAGVALLSGSATRGEELLRWQARQIEPSLPPVARLLFRVLPGDFESRVAKNHVRIKATTADVARIGGQRLNARWHREFMAYDPRADLARLTVPVLAVTGGKDLQTDPADLTAVAELVPGPVETHEVPDVSHLLRRQDGPASLAAYKKEVRQPVDARVLELLTGWTARVLAPAAA